VDARAAFGSLPMKQPQAEVDAKAKTSRRTLLAQAAGAGAAALLAGDAATPAQAEERGDEGRAGKTSPPPTTKGSKDGKTVARCGYRCDLCAARSDDPAVRQKLVDGWRKYYGHTQYTAENVKCGGCSAEKRADMTCQVRPCVIEKGIENCAACDKCPCKKLVPLCSSSHINFLRFPNAPQEDYDLCLRQFDNIPELMELRAKRGTK